MKPLMPTSLGMLTQMPGGLQSSCRRGLCLGVIRSQRWRVRLQKRLVRKDWFLIISVEGMYMYIDHNLSVWPIIILDFLLLAVLEIGGQR
jgi:hypothetical protein